MSRDLNEPHPLRAPMKSAADIVGRITFIRGLLACAEVAAAEEHNDAEFAIATANDELGLVLDAVEEFGRRAAK